MSLHPAVAAVRRGVRAALAEAEPGDTVVVACSGGADSLALAAATVFEGHKLGLRVVGATVDHGLQDGSAEQAGRVVAQLAALGVDETLTARVTVSADGIGPEAAAREARYQVLGEIADRLSALVLLGHTRDDQAETVLLGLARGSGGRSVAGMRRGYGPFRRPLLDVSRDDTVEACLVEGLEAWSDPHNEDPGYARVRVRRRVLPVLEAELGPGVAAALARTADLLRPDMEFLDQLAGLSLTECSTETGLSVAALGGLPEALRTRVLRSAAVAAGAIDAELAFEHVAAMDGLITGWRGQKWIDLPGHLRALRSEGEIRFLSSM
ncbi:tRNA lysidine(34) synthetase TilS [Nocardioides sp. Bht2]|uniref:tRNA lysidine(34) synthetase TilS n=1 Tax=Nocardioides sp. Bht2 TaxID=3392297 RepID=UPI0039B65FF7